MTVFTRTWNAAYEALPADGDNASEGANRIRDFKMDVQERGVVDHSWAGDADDGMHKKVTLVDPLGAKPTQLNDETYLYSKDVSATAELFFEDEAGNEIQLTDGGVISSGGILGAPSGTLMLFQQTAAPTGWTKQTTHNDKSLRVVSGAAGSGGATAFSSVFGSSKVTGSHVLTIAEMPAHTHTAENQLAPSFGQPAGQIGDGTGNTGSTGGGGGHTHTLSLDLHFVDIIIASKD